MNIKYDEKREYQPFEGIGASGAWWAQMVGGWKRIDQESGKYVRDRICELLYNKDSGLALNAYRYNIGGGSAESGRGDFSRDARRAECFEIGEGVYNFNRDKNAVYIMKKCVEEGADEVILFVNSPIERLTKNHKAHQDKYKPFFENISSKNYEAFAKYCLDVTEHFISEGLPIKYLSPINEPIWKWTGGQEGCHYKPRSCRKVFDVFAKEMEKRGSLGDIMLSGCESGDIRWFNKSYTKSFLNSRAKKNSIDMHSYFLPAPLPFFNNRIAFLKRYRKWMDKHYPDVPIKISEWTHMQRGRDKSISSALVMANVMFEDISILNVTSWQHWIAVSEVDYCDGLIYINLTDESFEITKRYYATGNFSKYIPKNATRFEISTDDKKLRLLAFKKDEQRVIIAINNSEKEKSLSLPFSKKAKLIVTDDKYDLEEFNTNTNNITLSPKSINTILYKKPRSI